MKHTRTRMHISICVQQLFRDLSPHQYRTEYHGPYLRNSRNLCFY